MTELGSQRSVTKIKLGGAVRTHQSVSIQTTPEASWLYAPEGTAVYYDTGELYTHHNTAGVQLLVPGEWWTAWWFQDKRWIAIDVTLPVEETSEGFRYTDLELDLWWRNGDSGIVDQDELDTALTSGKVDQTTAEAAQQVANSLHDRLQHDREFIELGFSMLDRCLDRSSAS
ncbi:DUF402 domain-containing protein [Microlunatus elymi]|uniref:DUF402 domain-containing protein n=1 Tax=Microlunatus elymi TaxID=2596828 RepID=UPI00143CE18D|nr:DUF402 domain-containing protein [Microlunatus elymi]